MTYPARELINGAYYLSSVVSKGFQSVSGEQSLDGLMLLNELLAVKAVDKKQIPYYKEYVLNPVPGQEKYFVPSLVECQSATFNMGDLRLAMSPMTRVEYFASSRLDKVISLPFTYHVELTTGGSNVYLYFSPQAVYPVKIWGKFGFVQITDINQDLSLIYDLSYLTYLRYQLSAAICEENGVTLPEQVRQKLLTYEALFKDISAHDFTRRSIIPLGSKASDGFNESLMSQRFGVWRV